MEKRSVSTHTVFVIVYLLLALLTLLPTGTASKECLLGYNALCSFTPISTVGFLALAGLHIYLQRRTVTKATP